MDKPSDEAKQWSKTLINKVDIDDLDALYSDLVKKRVRRSETTLKQRWIFQMQSLNSGIDIDAVKRELTDVKEKKNALLRELLLLKKGNKKNITKYLTEVKERIKILEEK